MLLSSRSLCVTALSIKLDSRSEEIGADNNYAVSALFIENSSCWVLGLSVYTQ